MTWDPKASVLPTTPQRILIKQLFDNYVYGEMEIANSNKVYSKHCIIYDSCCGSHNLLKCAAEDSYSSQCSTILYGLKDGE